MQMFKVRADLYGADAKELHALLDAYLDGGLSFVSRLAGYQMFYKTEALELSVETMEEVNPTYNFDARLSASSTKARAWTEMLAQKLEASAILFLLSLVEVDAAGSELSEEECWESQDFADKYARFLQAD